MRKLLKMNGIIKHLETMFNQELYSNIVRVCELTASLFEHSSEHATKLHLYLYHADALFKLQEYGHAESLYRKIIQTKKHLSKNKTLQNSDVEAINDVDVKYKIYQCCTHLKRPHQALEALQSVQARLRTAKINMALAELYKDAGNERSAVAVYKEVLREAPLALDAAENLLSMGVQGVEVNSIMLNAVTDIPWMTMWLKGLAEMNAQDYTGAINTFKMLNTSGYLRDNSAVLVNMAQCYNYMCDEKKAINYLQMAMRAEPHMKSGRDLLSTLLATSTEKEHHAYLERLLPTDLDPSLWTAEHFLILGNHMYACKKYDRALYFADQASSANNRCAEALLLKARTSLRLGKHQEAAAFCAEAQACCPRRYEIYACLVECYMRMNRSREAEAVASNACKQLNQSVQALTLHASVLIKDPMTSPKAIKRLLEKAIVTDPTYTPAVLLLAEQYEQEQQYEEASQLLLKHAETKPSSVVHQMIGDNFVRLQKEEDAFNHYCIALSLDPDNQKASDGLNSIGRSTSVSKRDSYYMSAGESSSYVSQGLSTSDHDQDAESDTEQWPAIDLA